MVLAGAARQHKRIFYRMVESPAAVEVTVRLPVGAPGTAANTMEMIRGPAGAENDESGVVKTLRALANNGYQNPTPDQPAPAKFASMGIAHSVDVMLRCKLSDALIDLTAKQGRTFFDIAQHVIYAGVKFEVLATERTGLPNGSDGPYILWVALRKAD